jgi:hypothetical protein
MVSVKVNEEWLTDGSKVYNVVLAQSVGGDRTGAIELPANSEWDANELADAIARLIARHTAARVGL